MQLQDDEKVGHKKRMTRKWAKKKEMEYVKALHTSFDMEKKLQEVCTTTIGFTSSAVPLSQFHF